MSAAAAIPQLVIESTWGPYVTGIMLQQLFLGVFSVQVYDYWRMFSNDSLFNRSLVMFLTVVTILQSTMDYVNLYRCAVLFYGNFDKFDDQDWTLWWEIGVTAIIGSIAQSFFLQRCWASTQSRIVLGIGALAIGVSLAFGLASTIKFAMIKRLSGVPTIPVPIVGWLTLTTIVDVAISAVLIWSLMKVKTPFKKTEAIVIRLVRITMETSSLTATVAIVNLVLYLALPGLAFHLLPQLVMGKMYAISVMFTLSSRKELRSIMASGQGQNVESRSWSQQNQQQPGKSLVSGVMIHTSTYQGEDQVDMKRSTGEDIELGHRGPPPVPLTLQRPDEDDDGSVSSDRKGPRGLGYSQSD